MHIVAHTVQNTVQNCYNITLIRSNNYEQKSSNIQQSINFEWTDCR